MSTDLQYDTGFTAESWEYANAFAASLGALPSSVTSVTRLLLADHERDASQISAYGEFFVGRFLKSRACQAPFFYALTFLKPEQTPPATTPFSHMQLLRAFSGDELAYLLAIIFYQRQARRLCDSELFNDATAMLQQSLNFGGLIGKILPSVGIGTGVLCGGFRTLAFYPFLRHDPEGFVEYMRHLQSAELTFDLHFEFEHWKCNSVQVALMILQSAGLGVERLAKLMKATGTRSACLPTDPFERACRAVDVWCQCLSTQRSIPAIPLPPELYLGRNELEAILATTHDPNSAAANGWLSREGGDLSPETTPQLFGTWESGDAPIFPQDLRESLPENSLDSIAERVNADLASLEH